MRWCLLSVWYIGEYSLILVCVIIIKIVYKIFFVKVILRRELDVKIIDRNEVKVK